MKTQHGGKRDGAGRKRLYNEPITRLRVPVSCVSIVQDTIAEMQALKKAAGEKVAVQRPAENPASVKRPLFSSHVPAGFPSPADDYIESFLDLNEHFVHHPSATFFVRATGDSMNRAGIFPGTILSVDRALDPIHGDIVIAVVNNEMTVKRLYKQKGRVELHPESDNSTHKPITFRRGDDLLIWGVVSGIHHKTR